MFVLIISRSNNQWYSVVKN